MDFTPTAEQLDWARNMVRIMKEGGRWGAPVSLQFYVFKHSLKQLWLVEGPDSPIATDVFEKNKILFAQACDYTVLDMRPGKNRESENDTQ